MDKIIGQTNIIKQIDSLVDGNNHLFLFIGDEHSGRKTLAMYLANKLNAQFISEDDSTETVHNIIDSAFQSVRRQLFIFNGDRMHISGKNSLLKITEEPPHNAYFCIICINKNSIPETLLSRGIVLQLEPYTKSELDTFIENSKITAKNQDLIYSICETPYDVKTLLSYNINDFIDYCNYVIDKINSMPSSSVFKLLDKLAFSDDTNKWDIKLFIQSINILLLKRLTESYNPGYFDFMKENHNALTELTMSGLNKKYICDDWILKVRRALLKWT